MSEASNTNNFTGYEIAVIGMDGRFPGAQSIAEFWENLKQGKNCIRFFTDEELLAAGVQSDMLQNPNYVKARGMLTETDFFDASFFNYTLPEAEMMDPQLRILHECCWKTLEDAGCNPDAYNSRIGFYVGAGTHYYWISRMLGRAKSLSEGFALLSVNEGYSISTQIAYRLNLKGPAVTLQTACSTSLVAIHSACQALLSGECDMALAGGVSIKLPQQSGYIYQEGMVLSPDGLCRPFDAKAAGTVDGSGVGVVALKPLENALADHDFIYAVVKGTAVNNDGNRRAGYSAPSVLGQAEVIQMAQQAAGIEPESISYIEAHGTATPLGDPVEIRALARAFNSDKRKFCAVGSVKSNIGHLDAAAGAAGFIKTVLTLQNRLIPPSLNFDVPNPEIDFTDTPFYVVTQPTPWQPQQPASDCPPKPFRAAVSSFGIGGTNAHVILEEWRPRPHPVQPGSNEHPHLLVLSAKTPQALERNTENLAQYLEQNDRIDFGDMIYTLQLGRKAFEYRRAVVCRDAAEAHEIFAHPDSKKVPTRCIAAPDPPLFFMFSGLGSQYVNMGYHLYQDMPPFRQEMDRCFEILEPLLDFNLRAILYPGLDTAKSNRSNRPYESYVTQVDINQAEISQPLIFSFEYALAKSLLHWGLKPQAMIGYSFGEYTAACIAGVFSLEDALQLIVQRGRLIAQTQPGAMLSVPLEKQQLLPYIEHNPDISLAIDNGPSCIIAGPKQAVTDFAQQMKQQKYMCMFLQAHYAIHSNLMKSIAQDFARQFKEIAFKEPQIPYISNFTGTWIEPGQAQNPDYWVKHLTQTVKFADGIAELVKEPNAIFLEIGPGRDLSTLIQRSLGSDQSTLNLVRPELKQTTDTAYLLERIGRLWLLGKEIDWQTLYDDQGQERFRIPLPTYSFEKQSFIIDNAQDRFSQEQPSQETYRYKRSRLPDDYEPPGDEIEEKVAAAFQAIFGLEAIGVHEDFFELGGDSLKVITLVTSIHRRLDVSVPMDIVFKKPTVKEIADFVRNETGKSIYAPIPAVEKREYYPLSPSQQRVFVMEQIEEKGMVYNMPSVIWMEGNAAAARLEKACHTLLHRHESLRTAFPLIAGQPMQRIYRPTDFVFEVERHDVPDADKQSLDKIIDYIIRPFDLSVPPPWRVGIVRVNPGKYLLVSSIHHIVSDDITTGVIIDELSRLYKEESCGLLPVQYKDYAVWLQETGAVSEALKEQKNFWLDHFSGSLPRLNMPYDFPRPPIRSFTGAHIEFKIDRDLAREISELARENKTTLFILLFAIYNTLLYKYTRQDDIITGTPITGRSHRDVQQVVGMFVNTLALRTHPDGGKTFNSFLQEVKQEVLKAFANQFYQFEDLVDSLNITRDMSRNPLFDTMFVLHTVNLEKIAIPGVKMRYYDFDYSVSRFDMSLNIAEFSQGLNGVLEYSTDLFRPQTMQLFKDNLVNIARAVVQNPALLLEEIELKHWEIDETERNRLLYEFNATDAPYPAHKTIHELFADQVLKTPRNAAVTGKSMANGNRRSLDYAELNEQAECLARFLRGKGVTVGSIVGIQVERSIEMLVGMFGVLKAGGAYLPLEPHYPPERTKYMIADSGMQWLLTHTPHTTAPAPGVQVFDLADSAPYSQVGPEPCKSVSPHDPVYVIYTSGSTGKPKGVVVEHHSLVNRLHWMQKAYPIDENDVLLQKTPIVFDVSLWELFWWSFCGAQVCVLETLEEKNPEAIIAAIAKSKVTICHFVPSMLNIFLEYLDTSGAVLELLSLRRVFASGEALTPHYMEKFMQILGQATGAKLVNLYGPTEATVDVSYFDCLPGETLKTVPIGKPIDNTRFYIVDESMRLQPTGVPGELCIAGVGLARGYLNNLELTAEKFVASGSKGGTRRVHPQNPAKAFDKSFLGVQGAILQKSPLPNEGNKIYKTGDKAQWLPDGNVEFLGRIDHQVKIRGFRIEPGEIENLLLEHEAINEAAVLAKQDENGENYLYAYLVSPAELDVTQIREYLLKELPDYMVPSFFLQADRFPRTTSGKIDRRALAQAHGLRPLQGAAYTAPDSDLEKTIAEVWQKLLNADKVGIDDNFFDVGGNSLRVIRAVSDLKQITGMNIPVVAMFRYPTIRALANFLNQGESLTAKKDRSEIKQKGRERLTKKRSLRQEQN